jgi:hypothetical protein
MSEVLSGSDARSGRFTIFPTDERQSLRLGRFLMAAGTSLLKAAGRNQVMALG